MSAFFFQNVCPLFMVNPILGVDLAVRAGGLNTSRVYTDSGKIRVRCISSSGKIRAGVFRFLRVSDQPNGFRALFPELFLFSSKIKNSAYLLLKIIHIQ